MKDPNQKRVDGELKDAFRCAIDEAEKSIDVAARLTEFAGSQRPRRFAWLYLIGPANRKVLSLGGAAAACAVITVVGASYLISNGPSLTTSNTEEVSAPFQDARGQENSDNFSDQSENGRGNVGRTDYRNPDAALSDGGRGNPGDQPLSSGRKAATDNDPLELDRAKAASERGSDFLETGEQPGDPYSPSANPNDVTPGLGQAAPVNSGPAGDTGIDTDAAPEPLSSGSDTSGSGSGQTSTTAKQTSTLSPTSTALSTTSDRQPTTSFRDAVTSTRRSTSTTLTVTTQLTTQTSSTPSISQITIQPTTETTESTVGETTTTTRPTTSSITTTTEPVTSTCTFTIVGESLAEAKNEIEAAGCSGPIYTVPSDAIGALADVTGGRTQTIDKWDSVTLIGYSQVPNVLGMTPTEAVATINSASFIAVAETEVVDADDSSVGTIVAQTPSFGSREEARSIVRYTVAVAAIDSSSLSE